MTSSLDGEEYADTGMEVTMTGILDNFTEDDIYEIHWQYSKDGEEYFEIDGANELEYTYILNLDNADNIWKLSIVLLSSVDED